MCPVHAIPPGDAHGAEMTLSSLRSDPHRRRYNVRSADIIPSSSQIWRGGPHNGCAIFSCFSVTVFVTRLQPLSEIRRLC